MREAPVPAGTGKANRMAASSYKAFEVSWIIGGLACRNGAIVLPT